MKLKAIVAMGLISFVVGCFKGPYQKKHGDWYWKDQIMREVTPGASVKGLNGVFATAGNQAFFRSGLIAGADGRTFTALNDHYAKDRATVYFCDNFRDGKEYFMIKHDRIARLNGADAASFKLLDDYYGRDKSNVYFNGTRFDVADLESFQVLSYTFGRDHATGYFLQRPITGSDGRTFAVVDDHYAKDAANVFYAEVRMEDGQVGATLTTKLPNAKPASFVSLGKDYGTDSARLYYKGKLMADAVPPLEILEFFYSKTAKDVYFMAEKLAGADPATFVVDATDSYTARDAHNTYTEGRKAKSSPKH